MTHNGDDINECAQNPNICQHGTCENVLGTYRCICDKGFQVDPSGKGCTDLNECEIDEVICGGGQCKNTIGSFQCICPTGTQFDVRTQICQVKMKVIMFHHNENGLCNRNLIYQ